MSCKITVKILIILLFSTTFSLRSTPPPVQSLRNLVSLNNEENTPFTNIPESIRILYYAGRLPSFNPLLEYDFLFPVMSLVYDSLVVIDPDTGELSPSLAKQWVVTNDSMEWIIYLRDDVVFHNGFQFNASFVEKTVEKLNNYSNNISEFPSIIDSCEILGEFSVKIAMKEPTNPFYIKFPSIAYSLDNLSVISLPEEIKNKKKIPEGGMVWPVGTGPYKLEEVTVEEKYLNLSFSRFKKHFRGLAPFQKIDYLFYFDSADYETAIATQEGEVAERYAPVINQEYWELEPRSVNTLIGYFNANREELRDPNVRHALNYALDRKNFLTESNYNNWIEYKKEPANILLPKIPEFDVSNYGYPYNLALAEKLLETAGYPRNAEGYRFNLSIIGLPFHVFMQDWLISSFDSIGIQCSFEVGPFGPADEDIASHDILLIDIFPLNTYYDLLHSNGYENKGNYSDQIMDLLTYLEKQTPVLQEKEYYERLILNHCQEQAPNLLLLNIELGYIKAKSISSLVHQVPLGIYSFNYSVTGGSAAVFLNDQVRKMEDIELGSKPLYFPFTDNILRSSHKIVVSTAASDNIQSFLPEFNYHGRFYKIDVSNQDIDYFLRCYYDPEDISAFPSDNFILNKWVPETTTWKELVSYSSNISLRYVEVKIKGNCLIRLNSSSHSISEVISYKFLPIVSIFVLGMVLAITITLVNNQKMFKYLRIGKNEESP